MQLQFEYLKNNLVSAENQINDPSGLNDLACRSRFSLAVWMIADSMVRVDFLYPLLSMVFDDAGYDVVG